MQPPSDFQLRTQSEKLLERHPQARLLGFLSPKGYSGASELTLKGRSFLVQEATSSLHFHRLAARSEIHGESILVLCPQREWLTQDLRDRLPERDLREIDPWDSIRKLFDALEMESSLQRERNLAQWLLEYRSAEFTKAPGGFLTREMIWERLLRFPLGLTLECYDPLQLLLHLTQFQDPKPCQPELARKAREWLSLRGGPILDDLLKLYLRVGARETLALTLVFEVLFLSPPSPESLMAQGSLERFLDGERLAPAIGKALGTTFRELVLLTPDLDWLGTVQTRAKELLKDVHALPLASNSLVLEEGWDALLGRAWDDLSQTLDLTQHVRFEQKRNDLDQLQMGQRLHRFLITSPPLPKGGLAVWMDSYLDEVAWIDRARLWLSHPHPQLTQQYSQLLAAAEVWRETYNQSFAQAAVQSQQNTLLVETFLPQLLLPLLSRLENGLLLIVLDGCSQAALLDLLESLDRRNWSHYQNDEISQRRLLSAFPSVTEVARTSLLCGAPRHGNAETEAASFARSPGAKLYHKKDVDKAVQRAGADDDKLVAVVLNSIDDTLAKEEQLKLRWTHELIAPMERLLDAARSQNRAVLLVSDHGHILDQGTQERPSVGAGNRWQPGSQPEDGAIVIEGGRLQLAPAARLLWTEKVRYGPRKRGYHGGLSPQEMVCAVALLAQPGQKIPGWTEGSRKLPAWWNEKVAPIQLTVGSEGQGLLFETVLSERLFRCNALKGREAPPDHLARAVDLLNDSPPLDREALAQSLGLTRSQLDMLLTQWTRWLNISGQRLLRYDQSKVWLDQEAVGNILSR